MNFKKRVKKGAALLDGLYEDWESSINLDKLDMGKFSKCILGQLFGKKHSLRMFGFLNIDFHQQHGFYESGRGTDFLTAEWKRVIKARQ